MFHLWALAFFAAVVVATLFPLPVWTARALRPGGRRPPLPPARLDAPHLSAQLLELGREAHVVRDLVHTAIDAANDCLVARPFAMLITNRENWPSEIIIAYQMRAAEAVRAAVEWVEQAEGLGEADRETLGRRRVTIVGLRDLLVRETALDLPGRTSGGRVPGRRDVLDMKRRLQRFDAELETFLRTLVDPGTDPYR